MHRSSLKIAVGLCVVMSLAGCGATHTAISKRHLEVKTEMSETLFLEPVSPNKQVVFVQVRNTSGMPSLDITPQVMGAIQARGYRVTNNPDEAYYLLQANVLQAGKLDNAQGLAGGYGEAVTTGLMGAAVGGLANGEHGAWTGAAAGAAVGLLANALIKDVTYSIITDVQISERAKGKIKESTNTTLAQGNLDSQQVKFDLASKKDALKGTISQQAGGSGSSTVKTQEYAEDTNWKKYRTRVISYANKVNLKFEEAQPQLVDGLARALAGVF